MNMYEAVSALSLKKTEKDKKEKMKQAIKAVRDGMHEKDACEKYKVARTSLRAYLQGKRPVDKRSYKALTPKEESLFAQWAINMVKSNGCVKRKEFSLAIRDYLNELKEPELRFSNHNTPGKYWYYTFLKRHPKLIAFGMKKNLSADTDSAAGDEDESFDGDDLKEEHEESEPDLPSPKRKPVLKRKKKLKAPKAKKARKAKKTVDKPAKVDENWFDCLEHFVAECEDPDLLRDPRRIFNAGETVFPISTKNKVSSPRYCRGSQSHRAAVPTQGCQASALCCISADGKFTTPIVIMPGIRKTVAVEEQFGGCRCVMSENGRMTESFFAEWLEYEFVKMLDKRNVDRPVLLLIDGSMPQKSRELNKMCAEMGILLFCFQSIHTNLLHPLELSFFSSFKHTWEEAVSDFKTINPGRTMAKDAFGLVFGVAYSKSSKPELAKTGFEQSGIFPFSKNAFLQSVKLLSLVTPATTAAQHSLSSSSITPFQSSSFMQTYSTTTRSNPVTSTSSNSQPYHPHQSSTASSFPQPSISLGGGNLFPQSSHVTFTVPVPSPLTILLVLEHIMPDQVKSQYNTRLASGYDFDDDFLYNKWKECKLLLASTTPGFVSSITPSSEPEVDEEFPPSSNESQPVETKLQTEIEIDNHSNPVDPCLFPSNSNQEDFPISNHNSPSFSPSNPGDPSPSHRNDTSFPSSSPNEPLITEDEIKIEVV